MINIAEILGKKIKKREILPSILRWLEEPECILIVGSRQVGKTSLLYLVIQHLFEKGAISDENLCFLDMEDPVDLEIASLMPDELIRALQLKGKKWSKERPLYLVFDEVHLLEMPSRLIKLLVDHHPDISLLATGSSSTGIRQKFTDSLPGRKQEFLLLPLSFREYLEFIERGDLKETLFSIEELFNNPENFPSGQLTKVALQGIQKYLDEYLLFGGYPRIALTADVSMRQRRLGAIFNDYIRKDLGTLFSIEHLSEFTRLVKILAAQAGGLLTYTNITSDLGINYRTLLRYLDILEATFILSRVYPYSANIKKRLVKTPKIYFYDNGLRNSVLGDFNSIDDRTDRGAMIESLVFQSIMRKMQFPEIPEISFWRTSSGSEVDFVWKDILIEVKSGNFTGNPPRSILSCLEDTKIKKALILSQKRTEWLRDIDRDILFFPYGLV